MSLLALLVAATTTAYAAGLAKHSVGAKQLKSNAVTSPKIKNGAVSAKKLRKGVVPPKTVLASRNLATSGPPTILLQSGGLTFTGDCYTNLWYNFSLTVVRTGGGTLSYSGIRATENGNSDAGVPAIEDNVGGLSVDAQATGDDSFSHYSFDGVIRPAGRPPVFVQVTAAVEDNLVVPCRFRVAATPTA